MAEVSRLNRANARELVETAAALRELPAIAGAAGSGALSWDQLAPLAQLATPADDEDWAKRAPGWSPAQLARALRAQRVVTSETAREHDRARRVTWWWDRDDMLRLRVASPPTRVQRWSPRSSA